MKSPQTNGICERFHKTLLDEFYRVAFRKKVYDTPDALQADLDEWMAIYNEQRTHQGRWCFGKTPMQTFLDSAAWAREKQNLGQGSVEGPHDSFDPADTHHARSTVCQIKYKLRRAGSVSGRWYRQRLRHSARTLRCKATPSAPSDPHRPNTSVSALRLWAARYAATASRISAARDLLVRFPSSSAPAVVAAPVAAAGSRAMSGRRPTSRDGRLQRSGEQSMISRRSCDGERCRTCSRRVAARPRRHRQDREDRQHHAVQRPRLDLWRDRPHRERVLQDGQRAGRRRRPHDRFHLATTTATARPRRWSRFAGWSRRTRSISASRTSARRAIRQSPST